MEPSPQPSKSRGSDHDYFVSSETTNSWKTTEERSENARSTPLACDSVMTTNRKPDDLVEVIEDGMVENMMLEQDMDTHDFRKGRIAGEYLFAGMPLADPSSDSGSEYSDDSNQDSVSERKASNEANVGDKLVVEAKTSSAKDSGVPGTATSPLTSPEVANEPSASVAARRMTNESSDFCLAVESDDQNDVCPAIKLIDGEQDAASKVCDSSTMSTASGDESVDFCNDEVDTSDVSSSISESVGDVASHSRLSSSSLSRKPRRRQPPNMIGYKKRRKVTHLKKLDDEYQRNGLDGHRVSEVEDGSHHAFESSSSEENLFEGANTTLKASLTRRSSISSNEPSDKYCWTCHKDSGLALKCLACPRAFHAKCYAPTSGADAQVDPNDFQCPECVAVLKADNINTRSPTLATVNLDQLCTSLKHVIDLLKAQKDSHYFLGPVDTEEFPHYREYITHPMDLLMLEKNVANKMYGCTEAFLADVKWIVHNSIVFNSKASKITNVAKNLLKICKREVAEIETCAECYYNSLVRIDTWFIEVCKRPHILVWARLKGYPPWPAKALKCKDNMVDCRFFGAHDKAWVPLKDCFLYSESPPQPTKIKKSSHLELGIQELEKHIFKLKDKFGIFEYPPPRTAYQPANELAQIRLMLPKYDPKTVGQLATKYLIHPDRVKPIITPKLLFDVRETVSAKKENNDTEDEKRTEDGDSESAGADDQETPQDVAVPDRPSEPEFCTSSTSSTNSSDSESSNSPEKESPLPATNVPMPAVVASAEKNNDNASAPLPSTSSKPTLDEGRKSSSEDSGSKPRKYVVVRDINSINATVVERTKPIEIAPKVSSSSCAPKVAVVALKANIPSTSFVANTVTKPISLAERLLPRKASAETASKDSPNETAAALRKNSDQFDLDKVKDEPIEVDNERTTKKLAKAVPSLITVTAKSKRAASNDELAAVAPHNPKKAKTDLNTTTSSVNLSKTVTLSVVNPATSAKVTNARPAAPPKNTMQVSNGNYVIGLESGSRSGVDSPLNSARSKSTPSPSPVARVVASTVQIPPRAQMANRSQIKILPRTSLPSSSALTNSSVVSRPPPYTVTVSSVKDASAATANTLKVDSTTSKQSIQGLDEILLNEYHTHFKKFFEDTLEKIGGRGDLRAKIVSLQKDIDHLKRSQELFVDELRREYETQIAELRATCIAKSQYDLAAERLKFEQEKEKAVKEAKSKQWCSNCQKCANYYCCWNTAYCDFECQKEHWLSHMHACKNDVKKKAAESSSENEPPRIMMQNDLANNYILNGYEKPGTATAYAYHNSNPNAGPSRNVKRQPTKITATKAGTYRPLLPRISSTTNTSSLPSASVSAVSSSHLTNSIQSSSENTTYPANYNAANPGMPTGAYSVAPYYATAYHYRTYCVGDGATAWPNNDQVAYVGNYNGQLPPEAAAAYPVDGMYNAAPQYGAPYTQPAPSAQNATSFNYYAGNAPAEYQAWNAQAAMPPVPAKQQYDEYYREGVYNGGVDTLKTVDQRLQNLSIASDSSATKAPEPAKFSYAALSRTDSYASSASASSEKKTTWASIAKQPAKPVPQTSSGSSKKKGPGMPPPPMVPGRHNIDLNTWEPKNNVVPKVPVAQAPPPPPVTANSLAAKPVWTGPVLTAEAPLPPPPELNAHHEPAVVNSAPPPPSHVSAPPPMRASSPPHSHKPFSNAPPTNRPSQSASAYQPPQMTRAPPVAVPASSAAALSCEATTTSPSSAASSSPPHSVVDKLRDKNNYNPSDLELPPTGTRFFVIKSYSEDDVHRSIKYEIWCSTEHGNKRLDDAFADQKAINGAVYLFFSVNGSGHFCGVARMISPVDYGASSSVWAQDKWKGQFRVRWIYVKDVPNPQLRHIRLENNENKPVTNSRDTQEVPYDKGLSVLRCIHAYSHTTSIFDDFTHYEKKQEEGDHNRRGPVAHQGPPMHHNNHSAPPHRNNPFDSRGMQNKDRDRDRERDWDRERDRDRDGGGGGSSFYSSQTNYRRGMRNNTSGGFTNHKNHSNALRS